MAGGARRGEGPDAEGAGMDVGEAVVLLLQLLLLLLLQLLLLLHLLLLLWLYPPVSCRSIGA
jgi:hypothetical protein